MGKQSERGKYWADMRSRERLSAGAHVAVGVAALLAVVGLGIALYWLFDGLVLAPKVPLLAGIFALVGVHLREWLGKG